MTVEQQQHRHSFTSSILNDPVVQATNQARVDAFMSRAKDWISYSTPADHKTKVAPAAPKATVRQDKKASPVVPPAFGSFPRISAAEQLDNDNRLGSRSRFGDGDGSFWDRWLVTTSTGVTDSKGDYCALPMPMSGTEASGSVPPRSGFKRFIGDPTLAPPRIIKYNEHHRRQAAGLGATNRSRPLTTSLTPAERKQIDTMLLGPEDDSDVDEEEEGGTWKPGLIRVDHTMTRDLQHRTYLQKTWDRMHEPVKLLSPRRKVRSPQSTSPRPQLPAVRFTLPPDEEEGQLPEKKQVDATAEKYSGMPARQEFFNHYRQLDKDRLRRTKTEVTADKSYQYSEDSDAEMKVDTQSSTLEGSEQRDSMTPEQVLTLIESQREGQTSSRGRFLNGCLEQNLMPRAGLIIRKEWNDSIDLSHHGVGDQTMLVLARALSELPGVQAINVADNKLTDKSLPFLAKALANMNNLTKLDVSENLIGQAAARAFFELFSKHSKNLRELRMARADLDDDEANQFVEALSRHTAVQALDLSRNKIGLLETRNTVDPAFVTGGEALAQALTQPGCTIRKLSLSWNFLRLASASMLGSALRVNTSLVELHMQYNSIGTNGGEALGYSLFFNNSLKYINLAHNDITASAAFVIAVAVKRVQAMRFLDLSGNPIGQLGAKEVLSSAIWMEDPMVLRMRGCNLLLQDANCWFDPDYPVGTYTLDLEKPYERAVLECLLMMAERKTQLHLQNITYKVDGSEGPLDLVRLQPPTKTSSLWSIHPSHVTSAFESSAAGYEYLEHDTAIEALDALGVSGGMVDPLTLTVLLRTFSNCHDERIGVDQFLQLFEAIRQQLTEEAYSGDALMDKATSRPWKVPLRGQVTLTASLDRFIPEVSYTLKPGQLSNLLTMGSSVESLQETVEMCLPRLHYHLPEAIKLYDTLIKDCADRLEVLQTMIPFTAAPFACRALIRYAVRGQCEAAQLKRLKVRMGPALPPFIGLPTGKYGFESSIQLHRLAIDRLLAIDATETMKRREKGLCDTSQRGDWHNLRNVKVDGKPSAFDGTTWDQILSQKTRKVTIHFDYVSIARPSAFETPPLDSAVVEYLHRSGVISRFFVSVAHSDIRKPPNPYDEVSRPEAKKMFVELSRLYGDPLPTGELRAHLEEHTRIYEHDDAQAFKIRQQIGSSIPTSTRPTGNVNPFPDNIPGSSRSALPSPTSSKPTPIRTTADPPATNFSSSQPSARAVSPTAVASPSGRNNIGDSPPSRDTNDTGPLPATQPLSPSPKKRTNRLRATALARQAAAAAAAAASGRAMAEAELQTTMSSHLAMTTQQRFDEMAPEQLKKASRVKNFFSQLLRFQGFWLGLERFIRRVRLKRHIDKISAELDLYIASSFFTAAQARVFVKNMPGGARCGRTRSERGPFQVTSERVETAVLIFSKVVDLQNFHQILRMFHPKEQAEIIFRLGMLNVWDPVNSEGWYELNLARREERQWFKVLLYLDVLEPGDNLLDATYKSSRLEEIAQGWTLPDAWRTDAGLQSRGFISAHFYSGEGAGILGCERKPMIRTALRPVVLTKVSERDLEEYPMLSAVPVREWLRVFVREPSGQALELR